MLRYVRECNPFEDNMQHTVRSTQLAVRLSVAKRKVFTARTVRDLSGLLLAQHTSRHIAKLNGTTNAVYAGLSQFANAVRLAWLCLVLYSCGYTAASVSGCRRR